MADELMRHSERIAKLAHSPAAVEDATIPAEAMPPRATMRTLGGYLSIGDRVAGEASKLAQQAGHLAVCATGLKGGGREMDLVTAAISNSLHEFADDANSLAAIMSLASADLGSAAAEMAAQALVAKRRVSGEASKNTKIAGVVW